MAKTKQPPHLTVGRAALLGLMRQYLSAVMDPTVTLLEIHKLMYFMQESHEPLKLQYAKGPYGPYAENLRHVLTILEGHYITGYGDAEDDPERQIELTPNAAEEAEAFLAGHQRTQERFEKVARLIEGFETPYGMELLSTVHWVARHEGAQIEADVVAGVHAWNQRKKMFTERHIGLAWKTLQQSGWLEPERETGVIS